MHTGTVSFATRINQKFTFSSSNQAEMLLLDSSRHATSAQHVLSFKFKLTGRAGDSLRAVCSSTARSAEARISILCSSAVLVSFEPGELVRLRCCSVCRHKSPCMPCTLALSFATRINRKVRFLFIKPGWDAAPRQQVAMQRLHNMYWVSARSGSPHNALYFD